MSETYRVVAGVDGSEGGQRALNWAAAEATAHGGTVQAIFVWDWDEETRTVVVGRQHGHEEENANRMLAEAIAGARADHPGVTISAEAVRGHPARTLTGVARDADLLVLGSHGHSRLFHAVVGSVAAECIRAASCPVVVVPVPRPPHDHRPTEVVTTATY